MTEETKVMEIEPKVEKAPVKEENNIEFNADVTSNYTTKDTKQSYSDGTVALNLIMDVGASQVRSLTLVPGKPLSLKSLRVTASEYAIINVDDDLSVYKKSSENILDNGEYLIKENENSPYIDNTWFQEPKRILKGKLISKLGKASRNIDNQRDKSNDIGMFVNILTSIANLGLEQGTEKVKVRIGFPIPPKERYSDSQRIDKLKKTVAGTYTVQLPRYDYTCNIEIDLEDIMVEAEGEAAYLYYTTRGQDASSRHAEFKGQMVTVQDLGSSTFNIALIEDGSIQSGVSHTAKYGGENLVAKLYQILGRTRSEPISHGQASQGVETGYITLGAKRIPIGKELYKAKKEVAETLYNEFVTFLQIAEIHATAIYAHLFVGRGMMQTGKIFEDGTFTDDYSPSIGQILAEEYSHLSADTKAITLTNPGLANLLGIAAIMKIQWRL